MSSRPTADERATGIYRALLERRRLLGDPQPGEDADKAARRHELDERLAALEAEHTAAVTREQADRARAASEVAATLRERKDVDG